MAFLVRRNDNTVAYISTGNKRLMRTSSYCTPRHIPKPSSPPKISKSELGEIKAALDEIRLKMTTDLTELQIYYYTKKLLK